MFHFQPPQESPDPDRLFRKGGGESSTAFPEFSDSISDETYESIEEPDSCYGTLRSRMYSTVGTFTKSDSEIVRSRSRSLPLLDTTGSTSEDVGTFSTFAPLTNEQLDHLPPQRAGFRESGISFSSSGSSPVSDRSLPGGSSPPLPPTPPKPKRASHVAPVSPPPVPPVAPVVSQPISPPLPPTPPKPGKMGAEVRAPVPPTLPAMSGKFEQCHRWELIRDGWFDGWPLADQ